MDYIGYNCWAHSQELRPYIRGKEGPAMPVKRPTLDDLAYIAEGYNLNATEEDLE